MIATLSPRLVHRPTRRSPDSSCDALTTPLGFRAGDTNLNRYVGNSPTNFTDPSGLEKLTKEMVDQAREEMRAKGLGDSEIQFRLKILENVHRGKTYFPDRRNKDLPERRNPEFWKETADGYVPKGRPTDSINDLWKSKNGIQCNKYSALITIKANIDMADEKRRKELDDLFRDKVIPNDLKKGGFGTFFTDPKPKNGDTFEPGELLPGDQIWFENPRFEKLTPEAQKKSRYMGEQGSNLYYLGDGKVIGIYGAHKVSTIDEYRQGMLGWSSVQDWNKFRDPDATKDDFQIKSCRRAITP